MRVAIDISQVIYGTGVSTYTRKLLFQLNRLSSRHTYLAFGGSLRRKNELDAFVRHLKHTENQTSRLSPALSNFIWNTLHVLPVEFFTGPVDLVHTSDWTEPPAKAPKITTVHDLNFYRDPAFAHPSVTAVHKKRLYWVSKESDLIIAVSHATKKDLIDYLSIDENKIMVIPEASSGLPSSTFSQSQLSQRLGITRDYILVPGCGHPRKNIKNIVQAFTPLSRAYQLVIVGRPTPDEKALASQDVIFPGYISDQMLGSLYQHACLVVFASLYEGFGLPILDAFAFDTPVVTSITSSMPEVAGDAAQLVDPTSVESIYQGILTALNRRSELVELGCIRRTQFTWKKTAQKTLAVYKKLIT